MKHLKLFFALFAMLALGVGNAWGADSGITASDGVFVIDFYNSDKLTSTSGTDLSTTNYSNFVKVASGLTKSNVVTSIAKDGTVQYNKNGGLTIGSSKVNAHYVTFNIGSDYAVNKITVYATQYESGRLLLNGKASDSGKLGTKGSEFSKVTQPLVWDNLNGATTLKFTKDNGSGSTQKRITIYTIVCEYTTSGGDESGSEETVVSLPTFTPESGTTFTESLEVTLSAESGCDIYYTTDDTEPTTSSTKYTSSIKLTESKTIKAIANNGTKSSAVATATYTKVDPTGTFTLHTGDLVEGDYVIVSTNALKAEVNSGRLASLPVTISGNDIVDPDATTIWHIAKNGEYWTLYNANKAKYAASTGEKNKAALLSDATDDKALWSVTGTSTYEFVNKKNTEAAVNANLRYNSQNAENSRWACYSTSTGAALSLYRKAGAKYNVTVNSTTNGSVNASPTSAEAGATIALTVTPDGGYVLDALTVTDASSNPVTVTDNKFTMPASDVTVSATFKENEKPAATLTLSKNGVAETFPGSWKQDDVVTLPSIISDCVKEFVGWSANPTCKVAPEYAAGDSYTLTATAQTLYAVYATVGAGETLTITPSAVSGSADPYTFTIDAIGYSLTAKKNSGSTAPTYTSNEVRVYAKGTVTLTAPKAMGTIVFNISTNGKKRLAPITASVGTIATQASGDATVTWTGDATEVTFTVGDNANYGSESDKAGQLCFGTITVTTAGSYSDYSTTCAAAPTAEVDPTSVTATATETTGKLTVTYDNVNTEDVKVALYNDAACTEEFTADWLTVSLDGDKNVTYIVSANTLYTERKAYIKLTAPETTGATDPDVVVIPVTQAAKDKVFASLEALLAAITPTEEGVEVTVTLTNEVIQDFYTSGSNRNGVKLNVPYQGNTKAIEIYCKDVPAEWVKGGKLSGTITCPWKLYNSTWELCPTAWTELTYAAPPTVSSIAVSGTPTKTTYIDGEEFDPAGLVVTATYTDASTEVVNAALVDWTFAPEILTKGLTSVQVTATYNTLTSAAYSVNVTVNDIPTKTVAEFIAAEGGRCYLEGIVSNITNTTYGNFDLTDASGKIYVYGCLDASGVAQKFATLGVKEGDKIKVIADVYELYQGTKQEAKNVQYVSHISAATITIANITMEVGETKTIAATITPDAAKTEVAYSIKAGSDDCITLSDNNITAKAEGTATIVATIATDAEGEYMGKTVDFTVTVNPVSTKEKVVILAQYDGKWYALKGDKVDDKTIAALEVTYFDGKLYNVDDEDKALIEWERAVVDGNATFKNGENYLSAVNSANLTLSPNACDWVYEGGIYKIESSDRTFLYRATANGFKNYDKDNADTDDYSSLPVVTAPVYATGDITYTRNVTNKYGTICLPYASASTTGAYFYQVVGQGTENGKPAVYLESVNTLEAGVPYIFEKTANTITVTCQGEAVAEAGSANGLVGTFVETTVPDGDYILYNNAFCTNEDAGTLNKIKENRAYLDMDAVTGGAPVQMPGRRYIGMSVQGENEATGLDNITNGENITIKTIENGQLIIIRNGEKFNAQGQRL